ncbi:MAG: sigma factor-like helix-turn-helix DNA-binding protein [Oscillospiraceae bacterium]
MDIFGIGQSDISTNESERKKYKDFLVKAINNALTPHQKEYIIGYYFLNMKMKDIAEEKNINISTVSKTIRRGTDKIKKLANIYF